MTIGNKIVELRKKHNFTQEKLAEKLDISRQTLANWENDITSPDLHQADKLAKHLKVTLDELCNTNIEINAKESKVSKIWNDLIGHTCYVSLDDDIFDIDLNESTPVKVLDINDDFVKIKNKKTIKLLDVNLVVAIKRVEGDR